MNTFRHITSSILAAAFLLGAAGGLTSCGKEDSEDILRGKYDYDLTQYITLAEYKGLDANSYAIDITAAKVQSEIDAVLYSYARETALENHPAEEGNTVVISYTGTADDGGSVSAKDVSLILGSGTLHGDIENGLMGHCAGETVTVDVTYPDPYDAVPDYAGKTVHYEIDVKEVRVTELPVYTDDFVKGYLGYDSTADYEAAVLQTLKDNAEETRTRHIVNQTWAEVVNNTEVITYPQAELNAWYSNTVDANRENANHQGISFSSYLRAYYNMTEEEYLDAVMMDAKAVVKEEMIVYAIARAENITLTEKEYTKRATEYALEIYECSSLEEFEEEYNKDAIKRMLLGDLVREFIAENANLIEGDGYSVLG